MELEALQKKRLTMLTSPLRRSLEKASGVNSACGSRMLGGNVLKNPPGVRIFGGRAAHGSRGEVTGDVISMVRFLVEPGMMRIRFEVEHHNPEPPRECALTGCGGLMQGSTSVRRARECQTGVEPDFEVQHPKLEAEDDKTRVFLFC